MGRSSRSNGRNINYADALADALAMTAAAKKAGTYSDVVWHICASCDKKCFEIHYIDGRKVYCPDCSNKMGKGLIPLNNQRPINGPAAHEGRVAGGKDAPHGRGPAGTDARYEIRSRAPRVRAPLPDIELEVA